MAQIFSMFLIVLIFWLIIEVINNRLSRNKKVVKFIDKLNHEKQSDQ